MRFRKISKSGL